MPTQQRSMTVGRSIGWGAAALLGAIFLVAAWGKAIDPLRFVEQIRFEGLDIWGRAELVAYGAIVIEVALGMALILGLRGRWVMLSTTLLVVFFLLLTGRSYWRFEQGLINESESCGCFGNLLARSPAEAFWQDLFFLGVPLLLAFVGRHAELRKVPKVRLAIVGAVSLAALILTLKAPDLPLDDWATRLRPGVDISDLCAGAKNSPGSICLDALITDLESGRHWVVLSDLDEEDFLAALPNLNAMALSGAERCWVLTAANPETLATFQWTQAPAFELREAPESLLRPLYRDLPRSFLVEEGEVIVTVSGLPPKAI